MTELVARSIVLSLAWFAGVNVMASAVAALAAIGVRKVDTIGRPRLLLAIRLFPSAVSLVFVGAMFMPSHLALEPRDTTETFGVVLLGLAGAGALVLGRSVLRAISLGFVSRRSQFSTRRQAVDFPGVHEVEDLPGVSLAGILNRRDPAIAFWESDLETQRAVVRQLLTVQLKPAGRPPVPTEILTDPHGNEVTLNLDVDTVIANL